MYRRDFGLCLRDYFTLTGLPNMIPRYMLGNIWNKNGFYTDQNIKDLINKFNKNEIPINLIILGNNWHSKSTGENGLSWNNDMFISYDNFIENLKKEQVKLGLTINPINISKFEKNYETFIKSNNLEMLDNTILNVYNKDLMDSYFNIFINDLIDNGVNSLLIDYDNINDINTLRVLN